MYHVYHNIQVNVDIFLFHSSKTQRIWCSKLKTNCIFIHIYFSHYKVPQRGLKVFGALSTSLMCEGKLGIINLMDLKEKQFLKG